MTSEKITNTFGSAILVRYTKEDVMDNFGINHVIYDMFSIGKLDVEIGWLTRVNPNRDSEAIQVIQQFTEDYKDSGFMIICFGDKVTVRNDDLTNDIVGIGYNMVTLTKKVKNNVEYTLIYPNKIGIAAINALADTNVIKNRLTVRGVYNYPTHNE